MLPPHWLMQCLWQWLSAFWLVNINYVICLPEFYISRDLGNKFNFLLSIDFDSIELLLAVLRSLESLSSLSCLYCRYWRTQAALRPSEATSWNSSSAHTTVAPKVNVCVTTPLSPAGYSYAATDDPATVSHFHYESPPTNRRLAKLEL